MPHPTVARVVKCTRAMKTDLAIYDPWAWPTTSSSCTGGFLRAMPAPMAHALAADHHAAGLHLRGHGSSGRPPETSESDTTARTGAGTTQRQDFHVRRYQRQAAGAIG
jgi:hypothetical protein